MPQPTRPRRPKLNMRRSISYSWGDRYKSGSHNNRSSTKRGIEPRFLPHISHESNGALVRLRTDPSLFSSRIALAHLSISVWISISLLDEGSRNFLSVIASPCEGLQPSEFLSCCSNRNRLGPPRIQHARFDGLRSIRRRRNQTSNSYYY